MDRFRGNYADCRRQFRELAKGRGARLASHPIAAKGPDQLDLTIDTARLGAPQAKRILVLLSGTHGVEAFAGSAIQAQLLGRGLDSLKLPTDAALLLVHAVNPFGFAWLRRTNENNVDLNRNFVDFEKELIRRPDYLRYDELLNPVALREDEEEALTAEAAEMIALHGLPRMQAIVSEGQYERPKGMSYGGRQREESSRHMISIFAEHVASSRECHLIDLHTGLGQSGEYTFLSDHREGDALHQWLVRTYPEGRVEETGAPGSISAALSGEMCKALGASVPEVRVRSGAAEFGTTNPLEVFKALRLENWLWHHGDRNSAEGEQIVQRLLEAFRPDSEEWRAKVLTEGQECIELAWTALFERDP